MWAVCDDWFGILQPPNERDAIAMIWVGVDESGSHSNSPCLCVAACVGSAARWTRFKNEWTPYATQYGEAGYHATAAKDSHNRILVQMVADIFQSGGFALRIAYEDVKAEVSQRHRSMFGEEYAMGIWVAIRFLASLCKLQHIDWLAYVIEDGHRGAPKAKEIFNAIKREPVGHPSRYNVYSDTWVGKEELTTHPADLVSHEWAKAYGKPDSEAIATLRAADWLFKDYTRDALAEAGRETDGVLKADKQFRDKQRLDRRRRRKGQR